MGDEIYKNEQILARIARLERQNLILKRGALAVLVCGGSLHRFAWIDGTNDAKEAASCARGQAGSGRTRSACAGGDARKYRSPEFHPQGR